MLVGYGRVSTRDQNPEMQDQALRGAGCERIFLERASGAQRDRPHLAAALDFMRDGDVLVVWKLDRLARSLRHLLETAADLESRGIGLRVLSQPIDTTTSGGRMLFAICGAIAEFERELTRERTYAGLASAKARGKKGGRPPSLLANDLTAARAMLRDPELSAGDVARRLRVSPSTLYRHLPAAKSAALEKPSEDDPGRIP